MKWLGRTVFALTHLPPARLARCWARVRGWRARDSSAFADRNAIILPQQLMAPLQQAL